MENLVRKTTSADRKLAKDILKTLERDRKIALRVDGRLVQLSGGVVKLLTQIFSLMANGKSIAVLASEAEVSTQEAAELLNFSRPYVVKLLEQGKIPFKKVGKHRRMLLKDVLFYKKLFKKGQRKALAFLVQQGQTVERGYQ